MNEKQLLHRTWQQVYSGLPSFCADSLPPFERVGDALLVYWQCLQRWNAKIRLTGIQTIEEYAERHIADSWMGWWQLSTASPGQSYLDVGTGAGFPAIPLAILRSDIHWTLVESHHRRAAFLQQVKRELKLSWVDIKTSWVAGVPDQEGLSSSFHGLTFRAVAPEQILPIAKHYLHEQGKVLYWGTSQFDPQLFPSLSCAQSLPYQLAGGEEFCLFLFEQL